MVIQVEDQGEQGDGQKHAGDGVGDEFHVVPVAVRQGPAEVQFHDRAKHKAQDQGGGGEVALAQQIAHQAEEDQGPAVEDAVVGTISTHHAQHKDQGQQQGPSES